MGNLARLLTRFRRMGLPARRSLLFTSAPRMPCMKGPAPDYRGRGPSCRESKLPIVLPREFHGRITVVSN